MEEHGGGPTEVSDFGQDQKESVIVDQKTRRQVEFQIEGIPAGTETAPGEENEENRSPGRRGQSQKLSRNSCVFSRWSRYVALRA